MSGKDGHPEHPLAAKLYREFRAGSNYLTKPEAYQIGNELDSQLARIRELEGQLAAALTAGRELVRKVRSSMESLS